MRPTTPKALPATTPQFHVQVGAFRLRENAEELVLQLQASRYPAAIVKKTFYLVWVGPVLERPAAERLAKNLQENGFEAALTSAP